MHIYFSSDKLKEIACSWTFQIHGHIIGSVAFSQMCTPQMTIMKV